MVPPLNFLRALQVVLGQLRMAMHNLPATTLPGKFKAAVVMAGITLPEANEGLVVRDGYRIGEDRHANISGGLTQCARLGPVHKQLSQNGHRSRE